MTKPSTYKLGAEEHKISECYEKEIQLNESLDRNLSHSTSNSFHNDALFEDLSSLDHITIHSANESKLPGTFLPEQDILFAKLALFIFGLTGVLNWSVILNSIYSVFDVIYEYESGADTILIPYFFLSLIVGIIRLYLRNMSPWYFHAGVIILLLTSVMFPFTISFIPGFPGIITIHFVSALIGLGVSLIVSSSFAYASILPINLTGFTVAGNGFAGLLGFLCWQFFTNIFFDIKKATDIKFAIIATYCVCFITVIMTLLFFLHLSRKPWFKIPLEQYHECVNIHLTQQQVIEHENSGANYHLKGMRSLKFLVADAKMALLMGNGAFFLSYSLFPNIGPYEWKGLSLAQISILVGIYQATDSLGRYIPNISEKTRLPYKVLIIASCARLIFYPIFFCLAFIDTPFTSHLATQAMLLLIFGLSHGVCSSQALSTVPTTVKTLAERGMIGMCLNITMQLALTVAISFSAAIIAIFKI